MTLWWELCAGDEYSVGIDPAAGPDGAACVVHDGERLFVFEGGYGDDGGHEVTERDLALVVRRMGSEARTERSLCDVLEDACDALICGDLPPAPAAPAANDVAPAALVRAFALIAAPEKSTPAGATTPAG